MSRTIVKTRKIGGSIVVRIPKDVAEREGIREDEFVEIDVKKAKGEWYGAFPTLKKFSREEELEAHD
jgi:antitoxin component of MazEF toxin-antitoxin module